MITEVTPLGWLGMCIFCLAVGFLAGVELVEHKEKTK